jgi:hypothetical protein
MALFVAAGLFAAAALLTYFLGNLYRAALWAHEECPAVTQKRPVQQRSPTLWFAVCVWFSGGAKPLRTAK